MPGARGVCFAPFPSFGPPCQPQSVTWDFSPRNSVAISDTADKLIVVSSPVKSEPVSVLGAEMRKVLEKSVSQPDYTLSSAVTKGLRRTPSRQARGGEGGDKGRRGELGDTLTEEDRGGIRDGRGGEIRTRGEGWGEMRGVVHKGEKWRRERC